MKLDRLEAAQELDAAGEHTLRFRADRPAKNAVSAMKRRKGSGEDHRLDALLEHREKVMSYAKGDAA